MEQSKIENLLAVITERLELIDSKINNMDSRMDNMQNDFSSRLDGISADVSKVKVTLENEVNKKIQLLAEGFQPIPGISEKVDSLSEDMEIVKFDVDIVKKVVTTHSTELNKLGVAISNPASRCSS